MKGHLVRIVALACAAVGLGACEKRESPDEAVGVIVSAEGPWSVEQGATSLAEFALATRGDFITRIQFEGLPAGVTALAAPAGRDASVWRVELVASWSAPPGTQPVDIVAFHGSATARATVELVVEQAAPVVVRIASPEAPEVWTKSDVRVALEITGPGANEATLKLNGAAWRTLTAPFETTLETTKLAEGRYEITAAVARGDRTFVSEAAVVNVDRTAPSWVSWSPTGQLASIRPEVLQVTCNEPVLLSGAAPTVQSTPAGAELANVRVGDNGHSPQVVFGDLVGVKPGMHVQATLNGVVDRAGNPAAPLTWSWIYALWQPLDAAPLNPFGEEPTLSAQLLSNGTEAFAVWSTGPGIGKTRALRVDGWGWAPLGSPLEGTKLHAALGSAGQPMLVMWPNALQWNGTSWIDIGDHRPSLGNFADSNAVRAGLNHLGEQSIAAAVEESSGTRVRFARREATGWTRVLDEAAPPDESGGMFVGAVPGGNHTYVAHRIGSEMRWSAWSEISGWASAFAPITGLDWHPSRAPVVYLDSTGNPAVAGLSLSTSPRIPAILVWSGTAWTDLGPALAATETGRHAQSVRLAWSPSGELYAAWSSWRSTGTMVLVSRWYGSGWVRIGEPVFEGATTDEPYVAGLAFVGSNLYVLWWTMPFNKERLDAARYTLP